VALYDHIVICNRRDMARFRPFLVAGQPVGFVRADFADKLADLDTVFRVTPTEVALIGDGDFDSRSLAMARAGAALVAAGHLPRSREELYPVAPASGAEPMMQIDRAWVPPFGIIAGGVHVNGYVRARDGIEMWVGVRALDRTVAPGKLDNMIAGGQPIGITPAENVVKEATEEADVSPALAAHAHPVGAVTYVMEVDNGLRRDALYIYDLELPDDFEPHNNDGEIEGFLRWPAHRAVRVVRETEEFKFNVALVIIDFAIRHGLIDESEPDYLRLLRGLHDWA
jgi:hypothetical protein